MTNNLYFRMDYRIFQMLEILAIYEANLTAAIEAGWFDLNTGKITASGLEALRDFHKPRLGDWYLDARGFHRLGVIDKTIVGKTLVEWNGTEVDSICTTYSGILIGQAHIFLGELMIVRCCR